MVLSNHQNYPYNLPSYHAAFDDGALCTRELNNESTSWRSEKYPARSNVLVLDHDHGHGKIRYCNDDGIDKLLSVMATVSVSTPVLIINEFIIKAKTQPQLRIILLQPTPQELLADQVLDDKITAKRLQDNQLLPLDTKTHATVHELEPIEAPFVRSQLDISREALHKVLTYYNIAPAACTHIRGQEQIYGSRVSHASENEVDAFEWWYAIRARAFISHSTNEADLKITIVTRYDVKSRTTFVLLKYRSFNDLANVLKNELVEKLKDFIEAPSTGSAVENPFTPAILHFSTTIQYYRRAARGPRDSVRDEERKVHDPKRLQDINIRRLHLSLASLDQDKIQLAFILSVISRLRTHHEFFYQRIKKVPKVEERHLLWTRVEEEFDRFENHFTYCKHSVEDVATRAERLMKLTFDLNTKITSRQAISENASMTTIALITMIFLPGTFVTGVFGSNFIGSPDRDHIENTNVLFSKQWWILPTVTIPLTILVLCIWAVWRRYAARRRAGPIFGDDA